MKAGNMSDEAILETIKAELDTADAATLKSIWQNLREAKRKAEISPALHKRAPQFIGENPSFNTNRQLSLKERAANKLRLKNQNREWLSQNFESLRAAWLEVMAIEENNSAWHATTEPLVEAL